MKAKEKNVWQVQEAKAKLSAVIQKAAKSGPQVITKHGAECAAVISIEDLQALRTQPDKKKPNFVDYLLSGPKFSDEEIEIMFKRDPDPGRMIDFSGPEFARDDEK